MNFQALSSHANIPRKIQAVFRTLAIKTINNTNLHSTDRAHAPEVTQHTTYIQLHINDTFKMQDFYGNLELTLSSDINTFCF